MGRCLLIVDDENPVSEGLQHFLYTSFDEVLTADSSERASELLGRNPVTHLLCDVDLGAGQPPGPELLAGWRREFPSIRFAALLAGKPGEKGPALPSGVDACFAKSSEVAELINRLRKEP